MINMKTETHVILEHDEVNDILHYLVDAFAINKDIINNDFYIVVWKGDKDKVAIKELRKWQ